MLFLPFTFYCTDKMIKYTNSLSSFRRLVGHTFCNVGLNPIGWLTAHKIRLPDTDWLVDCSQDSFT